MKRFTRILIALILLLGLMPNITVFASPAFSTIIPLWEQLRNSTGGTYSTSSSFIMADDFSLSASASISQIEFWHDMDPDGWNPPPAVIQINFYENAAGNLPGTLIRSESITDAVTEFDGCGCTQQFRTTLTLSTALDLTPGRYWVAIYASYQWFGWAFGSSSGLSYSASRYYSDAQWYSYDGSNFAFRISGVITGDTSQPVVTVPEDMTVPATSASGAVVTFSASATDDVDGTLTPTCVPSSGSTFPIGTNTVTCSATDAAGNTGSAQFTVTVVGISGADLPAAEYTKPYSQQLTAEGGTTPYTFSSLSGTLPSGLTLSSSGLLSGLPQGVGAIPGTYPITIQVVDGNSITASRDYDFVVIKSTPTMDVRTSIPIYWHRPFNLAAEVRMVTGPGTGIFLSGTVSFSVDGDPVTECQNVPYVNGYYFCEGVTSVQLEVGSHTVSGTYTPSTDLTDYYNSTNDSSDFTVDPIYFNIMGMLFDDQNKDGVKNSTEYSLGTGWRVDLDQDCDGIDKLSTTTAGYPADYTFSNVTAGHNYCISTEERPGYQRTTPWPEVYLTDNVFTLNVGFYYPRISLSPIDLPSVNLGNPINQQFSASGGEGPYTYRISWGTIPDGLSFSEAGLLSGTPTAAGSATIEIEAEDANQAVGKNYYRILVTTDGVFNFTSSSNPSLLGDPVTFTISASGSATDPSYGTIPPIGGITFYADGETIDGCSYLDLNQTYEDIGDYPVTCVLSTLGEGSHEITATFMPYSDVYNIPTLELIQVVQVVQENLIFLPLVLR